jgi:2-C-methyl-D-erythritol 4-phosphate cytidylyltransferase
MNIAMILAGGMGARMGIVEKPKQFIDVYGKAVIVHTLEAFDNHPSIDYIAIICLEEWFDDLKILLRKYEINKVKWIIKGGATRQESIYNGINALSEECAKDDIIVIHDSVRPLISHKIISDNISGAIQYGAVDTVIPATDTIVRSIDDQKITDIPVRKELYLGQTPQSFKFSLIQEAHNFANNNNVQNATEDCQLVLKMGRDVHLVAGDKMNFKITSFDDLLFLKAIVKMSKSEMI